MKIGVYGGSFDPIHQGHIDIIKNIKSEFGLDRVIVPVTASPPHKQIYGASASDRLKMTRLALQGLDGVEVSDYEQTNQVAYTCDTLQHYSKLGELYLIIGEDSLVQFYSWKNPQQILDTAQIICVKRPHTDNNAANKVAAGLGGKVAFANYCGLDVSSTKIRVFCEFGLDVEVPQIVLDYITQHNLYSDFSFYTTKLKSMLSKKRYMHTAYTAIEAQELARRYDVDFKKTMTAAILHDCAKEIHPSMHNSYGFNVPPDMPSQVAHAFLGEYVAKKDFNVTDTEILQAIKWHSTAVPDMSDIAKIIYIADYIEQSRTTAQTDDATSVRQLSKQSLEKAFLQCLKLRYGYLNNKETNIKYTKEAYDYYFN